MDPARQSRAARRCTLKLAALIAMAVACERGAADPYTVRFEAASIVPGAAPFLSGQLDGAATVSASRIDVHVSGARIWTQRDTTPFLTLRIVALLVTGSQKTGWRAVDTSQSVPVRRLSPIDLRTKTLAAGDTLHFIIPRSTRSSVEQCWLAFMLESDGPFGPRSWYVHSSPAAFSRDSAVAPAQPSDE